MTLQRRWWNVLALAIGLLFLVAGCSAPSSPETEVPPTATPSPGPSEDELEPTSTPTPTPAGGAPSTSVPAASRCAGFSGEIEVQVLVGPAEAVGLEPVAVGRVPIAVVSETPPYQVEGAAPIAYESVLEKEWGTYAVTLDMDVTVNGECVGAESEEELRLQVAMSGEQMVEVNAEGFQGEYPWSGEQEFDVVFPVEEGATVAGEGWTFVLHLTSS
jgi:hypothetical protein